MQWVGLMDVAIRLITLVAVVTGRVGYLGAWYFGDVRQRVLTLVSPVRAIPVVAC